MPAAPLIVLIDGDCALCNGSAAWFARRNAAGRLIFATNRGEVACVAGEPPGGDPDTIVVWDGSRRLVRSQAVRVMLAAVGGGWAFLSVVAGCLPVRWLDCAYDQVARRRHRFAGPAACTRLSPHDLAE
jgi:predicted DCC family thiol-disulfide oxidoreductase YuxK